MWVFTSPGSVAFSIFGFDIYYYGIIMAIAVCVMLFGANYAAQKQGLGNLILDFSPYILLSGIAGARLYYCLLDWQYYFAHPLEILAVRNGGLSIHGALLAGFLSIFFLCKKHNISVAKMCDTFALSIPLAQAIGRWGNFFNSEAFGLPTNCIWKLYIPLENRPFEYIEYDYFHPTFLYESLLDLSIFFIMLVLLKKGVFKKAGVSTCIYLILYSIVRIFIETIRIDSTAKLFGIAFPIYISLIILIISSLVLVKKFK